MISVTVTVEKILRNSAEVVWEATYPSTHAANDQLGTYMGSREFGLEDLSGLSLGEFRGRLYRLLKRLPEPSLERELVEMIYEDPALPNNEDLGKKLAVVNVTIA